MCGPNALFSLLLIWRRSDRVEQVHIDPTMDEIRSTNDDELQQRKDVLDMADQLFAISYRELTLRNRQANFVEDTDFVELSGDEEEDPIDDGSCLYESDGDGDGDGGNGDGDRDCSLCRGGHSSKLSHPSKHENKMVSFDKRVSFGSNPIGSLDGDEGSQISGGSLLEDDDLIDPHPIDLSAPPSKLNKKLTNKMGSKKSFRTILDPNEEDPITSFSSDDSDSDDDNDDDDDSEDDSDDAADGNRSPSTTPVVSTCSHACASTYYAFIFAPAFL